MMFLLPPPEDRLLQDSNENPSRPPSHYGALAGRLGLTSLLIILFLLVMIAKLCFGHRGLLFRDDRTAPMGDDDLDLYSEDGDEDNDLEKKRDDEEEGSEKKRQTSNGDLSDEVEKSSVDAKIRAADDTGEA